MMMRHCTIVLMSALLLFAIITAGHAAQITTAGRPAQLDVCASGEHSVRVTLKPVDFEERFPLTPALTEREYPTAVISLREIGDPVKRRIGNLFVDVRSNPLSVIVTNTGGEAIQDVIFDEEGNLTFKLGGQPVLGMGEGGPQPGRDWLNHNIEFDRRGRLHEMRPRWQSNAYGSRNPVALMMGTEGWGLFVATPWGQIDLQDEERGKFIPWQPPEPPASEGEGDRRQRSQQRNRYTAQVQGRPPVDSISPGVFDLFIFDAHEPANLMKDVSVISGPAVLPPRWSLGYMQSHRELVDAELQSEDLLLNVVDTFRKKQIPIDAVIYLGTGFTPTGWNTRQPSFEFNPEVFKR